MDVLDNSDEKEEQEKVSSQKDGKAISFKSFPVRKFASEIGSAIGAGALFIILVVVLFMTTVNSLAGLFGFILLFGVFMVLVAIILIILIIKKFVESRKHKGAAPVPILTIEKKETVPLSRQLIFGLVCVIVFAVVYNAVASF